MRLLALCLCTVASYALAEEPVEHRSESDSQNTRIYSLGTSGLNPIVPASTSLLTVGSPVAVASPYHLGGGGLFPGGFPNNNNFPGGYPNNNNFPGGYPNNNNFPGGYPNNNNFPGQGGNCRYWCKTPQNQYYCCENPNQQTGGNVGTKPGSCPAVRPSCPPTRVRPRPCSNDYSCPGSDKCCYDTCLQHHTCKPIVYG